MDTVYFAGVIPTRAKNDDSAYDLYASQDLTIEARSFQIIKTGTFMAIPEGYIGKIECRSGLAAKGCATTAGVIDPSYRGEVGVIMHNHSDAPIKIEKNNRIAQIYFIRGLYNTAETNRENLPAPKNQRDGFGSTGV